MRTARALMVMPRSRSSSILSSSCSSISRCVTALHCSSKRSASVDLPWSICAIIEKLRMFCWFFTYILLYAKRRQFLSGNFAYILYSISEFTVSNKIFYCIYNRLFRNSMISFHPFLSKLSDVLMATRAINLYRKHKKIT